MSFKNEWSKKHKNISYLRENALWIIMDPWYPTPFENDFIKCPHIDSHNEITLNNILNYFSIVIQWGHQYIHIHYKKYFELKFDY